MKVDDFGVWEIRVPPLPSGRCAIPHDTKIKVRDCIVLLEFL